MTAGGVIPAPEDREPSRWVQTGAMDGRGPEGALLFGAEGDRVIIMNGWEQITLSPDELDTFVRHLFRAILLAEQGTGPADAPF